MSEQTQAAYDLEAALKTLHRYTEAARAMQNGYVAISADDAEIIYNEVLRLQNENANLIDRLNELTPFVQQFGRAKRKQPEVINFYSNPAPITPFQQIFGSSKLMRDPSWLHGKWVLPTGAGSSLSKEALAKAHLSGQISLVDYHARLKAAEIAEKEKAKLRFEVGFSAMEGHHVFDNLTGEVSQAHLPCEVAKQIAERLNKQVAEKDAEDTNSKPAKTVGNIQPIRFSVNDYATYHCVYDNKLQQYLPFDLPEKSEAETLAAILNSFVTKE